MRTLKLGIATIGLLAATGCDYSGDWLFSGANESIPGVIDLGELTPADVASVADIEASTLYGEVAPTGTAVAGGVTFTFEGTGGNICVWVDPEILFWNQSVSPTRPLATYAYPNNVFDDGDLDLSAGFAAYYNGSPGEAMGDFEVRYTDSLGNPIAVGLNECTIESLVSLSGGHAGRGAPEYCTLENTQPGVNYLVAMSSWSTPLDDERMGYGLLLTNGTCGELMNAAGVDDFRLEECMIVGEGIRVDDNPDAPGPWFGLDEVPSREGSIDFENAFCTGDPKVFCETEAAEKDCDDPNTQCFCGNPADTPSGGSL